MWIIWGVSSGFACTLRLGRLVISGGRFFNFSNWIFWSESNTIRIMGFAVHGWSDRLRCRMWYLHFICDVTWCRYHYVDAGILICFFTTKHIRFFDFGALASWYTYSGHSSVGCVVMCRVEGISYSWLTRSMLCYAVFVLVCVEMLQRDPRYYLFYSFYLNKMKCFVVESAAAAVVYTHSSHMM